MSKQGVKSSPMLSSKLTTLAIDLHTIEEALKRQRDPWGIDVKTSDRAMQDWMRIGGGEIETSHSEFL